MSKILSHCGMTDLPEMGLSLAELDALMLALHQVEVPCELIGTCKLKKHEPRKKANRSSLKKSFNLSCEVFIKLCITRIKSMEINWSALFHRRMIVYQDLLPLAKTKQWTEGYHHYCNWTKNRSSEYFIVAKSLLTFFTTHYHDPDNALIGMRPKVDKFKRLYERTADGKKFRLPNDVEVNRTQHILAEIQSSSFRNILKRNMAHKEIIVPRFYRGQIVLWCREPFWQPSNIIFVRVGDEPDEDRVLIYSDPLEKESEVVPLLQIMALHPEMIQMLTDKRSMQNIIQDPIDDFYHSVSSHMKERTNEYLLQVGLDSQSYDKIISRSETDSLTMDDLHMGFKMINILKKWQEDPPKQFYQELEEFVEEKLQEFVERVDNDSSCLFQPTKVKSLLDIQNMDFLGISKSRITRLTVNCESIMNKFEVEKAKFLSGEKKKSLTTWWFAQMQRATEAFLQARKYDDTAIPENYIEEKPENLDLIRHNLYIIQHILQPVGEEETKDVKDLVSGLTEVIYPKINHFLDSVGILLGEMLNFDAELFNIEISQVALSVQKDTLDPDLYESISGLIKDAEYLFEMQEMEKESFQNSAGGGIQMSNVVPISGLIMSNFFRRENVLKTVLELHDYVPKPTLCPINQEEIGEEDIDA